MQVAWLPVGFAAAILYLGDLRWLFGPALEDVLLGTGVLPFHGEELTRWTQLQRLGNVIEFTLIAVLMRRWLDPRNRLERPLDVALLLLAIACGTAVSAAVAGLSVLVFASHHRLTYVVFPVPAFAALNLGQRGATVAVLLAIGVAVARTADRAGPFATSSIDDATLGTQLYILVAIITTVTLGAVVSSRREAAVRLAESRRREAERAAAERRRIAGDLHDSVSDLSRSLGPLVEGPRGHCGSRSCGRPRIDEYVAGLCDMLERVRRPTFVVSAVETDLRPGIAGC